MKTGKFVLVLLAALILNLSFLGCRTRGPIERTGDAVGTAVDSTGRAAGHVVRGTGNAVEDVVRGTGDVIDDVTR